tara:strand:+ start:596 stop:1564 length:969 start_codon:yes stop_codon:yes gene_type:complete
MGLFSKIKKGLKKVVKKVAGGIKKVVKKVGKVVKKISKSKLFKAIATIGAIIVTGGAAIGAFGGSLASSTFGSWMVGASNTIAGGTLFGTSGNVLAQAGNFATKMLAKPFAATGKAIGSVAGGVSDFTGLTSKQGRMGYKLDAATGQYIVDTEKTLQAGSLGGKTVAELRAAAPGENIMAIGKGVDAASGEVMLGELQTRVATDPQVFTGDVAKTVADPKSLTGSKWGDFAVQTAANVGGGVMTGYALNELTAGDPRGQMSGLAVEGKEFKDPNKIYLAEKGMSIEDIYQNILYGPADPLMAATTELFKQQTVGLPALTTAT